MYRGDGEACFYRPAGSLYQRCELLHLEMENRGLEKNPGGVCLRIGLQACIDVQVFTLYCRNL
ncbi:MAG: hypothetical protein QW545_02960 [Thermosphaera sp.]